MLLCGLFISLFMLSFGGWGIYSTFQTEKLSLTLQQSIQKLEQVEHQYQMQLTEIQGGIAADQKKLAVYARTLGQMQAHVARLDSLGSRLVDVASLNKSEFDFGIKPALGGPRPAQSDIFAAI